MNRRIQKLGFGISLLLIGTVIVMSCRKSTTPQLNKAAGQHEQKGLHAFGPSAEPPQAPGTVKQTDPSSQSGSNPSISQQLAVMRTLAPEKSLRLLLQTMIAFADHRRSMESYVQHLQRHAMNPTITDNFQADTGHLYIIRAQNSYQGTRYLHAQYMSGDDHSLFLQHLSFEYKSGAQSLDQVLSEIQTLLPQLGRPSFQDDDFMRWKLPNGQVLWIKRLNEEDIRESVDDPFNAYIPGDEGTIRVAIEQEIHESGDGHDEEAH